MHRSLKVNQIPIRLLNPDPRNARIHSKQQIEQIAASIGEFSFVNPILIDERDRIIAGHGRLAAAQLLGLDPVPAIRLCHLSDAQKRALALADNKLAENAGWNEEVLAQELHYLSEIEVDFDVTVTGFSTAEIDLLVEGLATEEDDPKAEQVPEPPPREEVLVQHGDLWQLGGHRLLCGDARSAADFERLLADRPAQVVFTDPPYNVPIDGHVCGSGQVRHREFAMASGEMTEAQFTAFLEQALGNLAAHSADGAIHFICMDWRHLSELLSAGRRVYSELKNVCVWVKDNAGMGSLYRSQHELVLAFKNGTAPHINNIELGRHGRNRSNIWSYPGVNSLRPGRLDELRMHPTVKPVALVADAIKDCSKRGGIVLDGFAGSGTTIIAAEKTGRRACAMEIDPVYVETAIRAGRIIPARPRSTMRPASRWRNVGRPGRAIRGIPSPPTVATSRRSAPRTRRRSMPRDYEIGYGKPPRHTRFKKGQCGNPKGRPKGTKNLKTDLEEELQEKIVVREGETRKEVSKQRAMIKGLVAKAMQGDPRAGTVVTNLALKLDMGAPGGPAEELADDDLAILEAYERRIRSEPVTKPSPAPSHAKPPSDHDAGGDE